MKIDFSSSWNLNETLQKWENFFFYLGPVIHVALVVCASWWWTWKGWLEVKSLSCSIALNAHATQSIPHKMRISPFSAFSECYITVYSIYRNLCSFLFFNLFLSCSCMSYIRLSSGEIIRSFYILFPEIYFMARKYFHLPIVTLNIF